MNTKSFQHPKTRRAELAGGQPIGRLMAQALRFPNVVSLAAGFVDNATLPCEAVGRCMAELARDESRLRRGLQYDTTAGSELLREAICDWAYGHLTTNRPTPQDIILTAGSNQLLHLIAESLFEPGDIVLAAAPTYFVFMGALKSLQVRVVGIEADEQGLCIDSLNEALDRLASNGEADRVKAIYSVTEFDNPAGSSLSLERRIALLESVERWRNEHGPLIVLSDNAYKLIRFEGADLPSLRELSPTAHQYVLELGTFSKSFSPGVRVGWGVIPEPYLSRLIEIKANIDFGSPHLDQLIMYEAIVRGEHDRHVPIVVAQYKKKRDAMLHSLQTHAGDIPGVSWRRPHGGLYVWLTLPPAIDASEDSLLWHTATRSGVLYVPGHHCYASEGVPVAHNTIRLSFGVQSPDGIDLGVSKLANAIREVELSLVAGSVT